MCVCVCVQGKRDRPTERGETRLSFIQQCECASTVQGQAGLGHIRPAGEKQKKTPQLGAVHLPFLWHVKTGGFALYIQRANTTRGILNKVPGRHTHSRTHKQLETFCKVGKWWVWGRDKRPKENSHQRTNEEKKGPADRYQLIINWSGVCLFFF